MFNFLLKDRTKLKILLPEKMIAISNCYETFCLLFLSLIFVSKHPNWQMVHVPILFCSKPRKLLSGLYRFLDMAHRNCKFVSLQPLCFPTRRLVSYRHMFCFTGLFVCYADSGHYCFDIVFISLALIFWKVVRSLDGAFALCSLRHL